jgi:predicted AAA+ superfamily ATPase
MAEYDRRVVDDELDELLRAPGAVFLQGARAVGKTSTATRRVRTVHALDDPAVRSVAQADAGVLLRQPRPILFDEWQLVPEVFDAVRRAVDVDREPTPFLLTGSASPRVEPTHTGSGRYSFVRMRPLALSERGMGAPSVSLEALLTGRRPEITGRTKVDLVRYADEIVASGFPGLRSLRGRPLRQRLDGYLEGIVTKDFEEQGRRVRKPELLMRWLRAYAAATATMAKFDKLRAAAGREGEDVPHKQTTLGYRDALTRLWLLEPLAAWHPTHHHLGQHVGAEKHHLVDPALAARLLGMDATALVQGRESPDYRNLAEAMEVAHVTESARSAMPRLGHLFGNLFESLVTQSVRVYAQAAECSVFHYRRADHRREIDLIVRRQDHRVLAIEIKLSDTIHDDDVRHLEWLARQIPDDVLDTLIVYTGSYAYRRPDGVAVVPAALLGP